ncbi:MAG: hypothetical protein IPP65_09170 [Chlorobi bacterium]|nr:hypothetical protein [Chlorobiota bacterium]
MYKLNSFLILLFITFPFNSCDNQPVNPNPNDRWLPMIYNIQSIIINDKNVSIDINCSLPNTCFQFVQNEIYKLGEDVFISSYFRKTDNSEINCPEVVSNFIVNTNIRFSEPESTNFIL